MDAILEGNTPELSDAERTALFGGLTQAEQADLANLFWQCETPEDRNLIYAEVRRWFTEAKFGVN